MSSTQLKSIKYKSSCYNLIYQVFLILKVQLQGKYKNRKIYL